jgi:intracellular sulfur oxidation DsrE/DsrF family protein
MSLLLLAPVAVRAAAAAPECNRVVLQVKEDDSRKWHTILANINKVQDAMSTGVRFVACGNSMQAMHLTKDDMIDNIAYARTGYVELMRLQQQGWTYIRP